MLQVISFTSMLGDSLPASGRAVTARPTPGQFLNQSLVDRQILAGTTDEEGATTLSLIVGVSYEIKITGWGEVTVTVNDGIGTVEAPYAFVNYLTAEASEVNASTGRGVALSVAAQDGTIWQLEIIDNGDGTFTPQFSRIA